MHKIQYDQIQKKFVLFLYSTVYAPALRLKNVTCNPCLFGLSADEVLHFTWTILSHIERRLVLYYP